MTTRRLLLLPAALALALPAAAQTVPDAGSVLRQLAPQPLPAPPREGDAALPAAPSLPLPRAGQGAAVRVQSVRIAGATVFPEAQLQALLQDAVGRELDLAGLEALADRVSRHYRVRGYTVARAYLPPQEVRDGGVTIAVVEGRFGTVSVRGEAPPLLPIASLRAGDVVTDAALERALLLAADVPGIAVRSTLQPGASVGTSDLVIDVQPGDRVKGTLEADNFGSRSTGHERVGASLSIHNPAGLGDAVALRAISSGEGLAYGRLGYQLPVDRHGTQAGIAVSTMRYELGREFASLAAHGTAHVATAFAAHPLLRSRRANVQAQLAWEARRLEDRADGTGSQTDRRVHAWTLGLSGDRSDAFGGGGAWLFALGYTFGDLSIDSAAARAVDDLTAQTAGSYGKATLQLARQQALAARTTLVVSYTGQWAGKNLDSSEKMSLGGAGGVRAYPQGEWPSDRASLIAAELRHALAPRWQGRLFVDAAEGVANARPWAGATRGRRSLSGAGVALAWAGPAGWSAQVTYAHKLGNDTATAEPDRDGRLWLQAAWNF